MSEADANSDRMTPLVHRTEWLLVLALVVVGTALRCWQPSHMAVEHFDEGVYASNLYCPPENAYPFRHLYAPSLLPALLEWALILSGGAVGAVMAVNVVAGCLMVPSVWWIGRQWFGPIAGLVAATMAAFSEVHILYSRTALTDGLLCLWMLWGVYWAWRAILTGRPVAILLAGLFATLAWWTKYNGWLTLAISGSGMMAWLVAGRITQSGRFAVHFKCEAKRSMWVVFARWSSITALAFVGWLPYLVDLQDHGGYAAVSANHARYFVGFGGWWGGLCRQAANLTHIETGWTVAGMVLSIVFVRGPWSVVRGDEIIRGDTNGDRHLAVWLLAAWFVGLFVAVPLYHPYPRLTLPFIVACWLVTGLALSLIRRSGEAPVRRRIAIGGLAFAVVFGLTLVLRHPQPAAWQDRNGLHTIATEIVQSLPAEGPQVVYVLGEPGLFFHLAAGESTNGRRLYVPTGNLASISPPNPAARPVAMFVILGPHAPDPSPDEGISWAEANITLVEEWSYERSTLVLLDEFTAAGIETGDVKTTPIRLFQVGASGGG